MFSLLTGAFEQGRQYVNTWMGDDSVEMALIGDANGATPEFDSLINELPMDEGPLLSSGDADGTPGEVEMQEFADKLIFCQEHDVQVTINQVMVPAMFDEYYERAERFKSEGLHVTLKPQSNEIASAVVEGYTSEQWEILQNDMEQERYRTNRRIPSRHPTNKH